MLSIHCVQSHRIHRITALCALAVCMVSSPGLASPVTLEDPQWSWSFDSINYVTDPFTPIVVRATFRNDVSSTMDMLLGGAGASFSGDLQKTFDFAFGPTGNSGDFGLDFIGRTIEPGGELSFVFGILTPIGGRAPLGTYPADPAFLNLAVNGVSSGPRFPTNTFSVTVVPEPSTLAQVTLALLLFCGARVYRIRERSRYR
jgi:hypothetical protein